MTFWGRVFGFSELAARSSDKSSDVDPANFEKPNTRPLLFGSKLGDDQEMKNRFSFTSAMRLRSPQDFERVYTTGMKAGDAHLLIFAVRNGLTETRLGRSVSRKHGCAVHRNLKRRRLREAFRLLQHELPQGLDLILIPRQRDDSTLMDYQRSLRALVERLAKRLRRGDDDPEANQETQA
jgi:ribonuclease P protein component